MCRYQGGPNAGHTIVAGGETFKIRQTPSGVISGKTSVIGAGCVVDPQVLLDELAELEARGIDVSVVVVSGNAHLIMPWHVAIDQASERRLGHLQIGTTRRGIGPAYADKASRLGIRVQDVLDPKILRQKIEVALAEKNLWLERIYEAEPFDLEEVWEQYAGLAERLAPYVGDVSLLVDRALDDGEGRAVRGRAGDAARSRPRDVSVRHLVEPDRVGRGDRHRHRADAHRPRARRLEGVRDARRRGAVPVGDRRAGSGPAARARRRVRHGDRPRAPVRLARSRRAPLRGARERDDVARADEARRALGLRRAAGVRALPAARRLGDGATSPRISPTSTTRSRSGRRCPAGRSRSTRRRRSTSCRARRATTSRTSRARSGCRSSWSASALLATACSRDARVHAGRRGRRSWSRSRSSSRSWSTIVLAVVFLRGAKNDPDEQRLAACAGGVRG